MKFFKKITAFCLLLLLSCSNEENAPPMGGPSTPECSINLAFGKTLSFIRSEKLEGVDEILRENWVRGEPGSGNIMDFVAGFIRITRASTLDLPSFLDQIEKLPLDKLKPVINEAVAILASEIAPDYFDQDSCAPSPNLYSMEALGKTLKYCSDPSVAGNALAKVLYQLLTSNKLDAVIGDLKRILKEFKISEYLKKKEIDKQKMRLLINNVIDLVLAPDFDFAQIKNLVRAFLRLSSEFDLEFEDFSKKLMAEVEILLDDLEDLLEENPDLLKNLRITIECLKAMDPPEKGTIMAEFGDLKPCEVDYFNFDESSCEARQCYYRLSINSAADLLYEVVHMKEENVVSLLEVVEESLKNNFLRTEALKLGEYFFNNPMGPRDFNLFGNFLGNLINEEAKVQKIIKLVAKMRGKGVYDELASMTSEVRALRSRCSN